jgi:protein SCO1/2
MSKRLLLQLAIGLLLGLALILVISQFLTQPYTYQGSYIDPPLPAADFSLDSTDGTVFRLSEKRGQVVLLFFGYTHCPDVCPTTLLDFRQVKASLGAEAGKVDFIFVTVDPERDTIEHLGSYVTRFDPSFIGLSGNFDEMQTVWDAYGVYRDVQDMGSAAGYLIDHTARVYVIDQSGDLTLTFPFGMESESMAEDIRHLVEEG